MSKYSLREKKKLKARTDILHAAAALISEHGYANAKMREIARLAEVSYQTLYNYFPTKARIAEGLLAEEIAALTAKVSQIIDGHEGDLLPTLHRINKERLDFFSSQDRELWRQLYLDLMQRDSDAEKLYRNIDHAAHDRLTALLTKARTQGALKENIDVDVMAHAIFSLSEYAMGVSYIDRDVDLATINESLAAQIELLVSPYVIPSADG